MKNNKPEKTSQNQRGGNMLSLIGMILMTVTVSGAQSMHIDNPDSNYIGMMPEVVITAPRYEGEDIAYCGMMPEVIVTAPRYHSEAEMGMIDEVVVTAPRYEGEDIAYCGMMPEVIVTAPRYKVTNPVLVLVSVLRSEPSVRATYLVLIERMNSKNVGYFN
jgi:hypothetical protein